jgi:hypothetical protein
MRLHVYTTQPEDVASLLAQAKELGIKYTVYESDFEQFHFGEWDGLVDIWGLDHLPGVLRGLEIAVDEQFNFSQLPKRFDVYGRRLSEDEEKK